MNEPFLKLFAKTAYSFVKIFLIHHLNRPCINLFSTLLIGSLFKWVILYCLNSLKNKLKKSIMRKRSVLYMNMAVMKRLNRQGLLIAGLHLLVLLNLAADFLYAS